MPIFCMWLSIITQSFPNFNQRTLYGCSQPNADPKDEGFFNQRLYKRLNTLYFYKILSFLIFRVNL